MIRVQAFPRFDPGSIEPSQGQDPASPLTLRYTSDLTAPHFTTDIGETDARAWPVLPEKWADIADAR